MRTEFSSMISAVLVFCSISWLQCKGMIEHVWLSSTDIHSASMHGGSQSYLLSLTFSLCPSYCIIFFIKYFRKQSEFRLLINYGKICCHTLERLFGTRHYAWQCASTCFESMRCWRKLSNYFISLLWMEFYWQLKIYNIKICI